MVKKKSQKCKEILSNFPQLKNCNVELKALERTMLFPYKLFVTEKRTYDQIEIPYPLMILFNIIPLNKLLCSRAKLNKSAASSPLTSRSSLLGSFKISRFSDVRGGIWSSEVPKSSSI